MAKFIGLCQLDRHEPDLKPGNKSNLRKTDDGKPFSIEGEGLKGERLVM